MNPDFIGPREEDQALLATEVVQGYVVARLVIGLEIFRGAIVRAMDIARDVMGGAGVWFSLCFEYTL